MADSEKKTWTVTYEGRTVVDTKALLRDPKVQETIAKLRAGFLKRAPARAVRSQ